MRMNPEDFKRDLSVAFELIDEAISLEDIPARSWDTSDYAQMMYQLFKEQFDVAGKFKCYRITGGAKNESVRISQIGFHPFSDGIAVPVGLCIAWFSVAADSDDGSDGAIRWPGDSLKGVMPPHGPVLYICSDKDGEPKYFPKFFIWYPESPLRRPMEELGAHFVPFEEIFRRPDQEILIAHGVADSTGSVANRSPESTDELAEQLLERLRGDDSAKTSELIQALKEVIGESVEPSDDPPPQHQQGSDLPPTADMTGVESGEDSDDDGRRAGSGDGSGSITGGVIDPSEEGTVINDHVELLNAYQPFDADLAESFFESSTLGLCLDTKAFDILRASVEDPDVRTVVLTGDAGHGKTHLCGLLVAELTGETLSQARRRVKDDHYGISEVAKCRDERSLRVIRDLSEKSPPAGGEALKRAQDDPLTVTIVCGNDGHLRSCAKALDLDDLVELLDGSVTRGQMRSGDGSTSLINLNHQSVVGVDERPSILVQVLNDWVGDDEKWEECTGCPDRALCPILDNRNQLRDGGKGGESRITAIRTLLQIAEQTGHTITIRELLTYVGHLITGGLRCTDVHARVAGDPGATDWQWHSLFHQVAFGDLLTATQLRDHPAFSGIRKLDPGVRAIRLVDDRLSDTDDPFGSFPPPYSASSGPTPTTTRAVQAEADEHRRRWRAARRWSFFEALADSTDYRSIHPSMRVGLRHIDDFNSIISDELSEERRWTIRWSLIRGLEAVQGIHRQGDRGELYVANSAFLARNSDTTVVGRKVSITEIQLMSISTAWRRRSADETPDISSAVDWYDRCIVLSLGGYTAPTEGSIELMLHEFEFLMAAANGLRSEQFFAAEIRRLFNELARQGQAVEDPTQLLVFSGLEPHKFVVDGETIFRAGS